MSWFSDLAGKAEAFLERVDQATATTIQNAQTPSRSETASPSDDVDTHIGELHPTQSPAKSDVRLEATNSQSDSMIQTQPKPPKDLARVGHVTPIKYFTPGTSKQKAATPTNTAALNNDSWLEYLNSPSQVQSSEKAVSEKGGTMVIDKEVDRPVSRADSDTPNKEIPEVTITG